MRGWSSLESYKELLRSLGCCAPRQAGAGLGSDLLAYSRIVNTTSTSDVSGGVLPCFHRDEALNLCVQQEREEDFQIYKVRKV